MLSIVLSGIGLAALGLSFLPNPAQGKTQGVKLSQLGYGHAPQLL